MSRIGSAFLTDQPRLPDIHNSFRLMGNEKLLHQWKTDDGVCCCTTTHYATLTDTRVLLREKEEYCCGKASTLDASIFLRDIAEMNESTESKFCCSASMTLVELRGIFGSEKLFVSKENIRTLQIDIAASAGNHKIVIH